MQVTGDIANDFKKYKVNGEMHSNGFQVRVEFGGAWMVWCRCTSVASLLIGCSFPCNEENAVLHSHFSFVGRSSMYLLKHCCTLFC